MVSSTTTFNEEQLAEIKPRESMMYEYAREGFSRSNFRYRFADAINIDLTDIRVDEGPKTYIDPDSFEMPHGPTGMGETGGTGIQLFETEGGSHPTYRFTQGFTTNAENIMRGDANLSENRRKVAETFDFLSDASWFTGIEDRSGNQVRQGMFEWLKANTPDSLTFDCSKFDGSGTGDVDDLVSTDTQENILKQYAYGNISGKINDTGVWDVVLGRQKALARLNKYRPADGGTAPRDTYWNRLVVGNAEDNYTHNNVGIKNQMLIPDELQFFETPDGSDDITIDLTQVLGEDELIILPDMTGVKEHYWDLRQMPSPFMFDPVPKEGGRTRVDYAYRYSHSFLTGSRFDEAVDTVHLTNISDLFV